MKGIIHTLNLGLFINYGISYSMKSEEEITIGERDAILIAIKNEVQHYIDNQSENELINGKRYFEKEMKRLEQHYSNNNLKINLDVIEYQVRNQQEDIEALQ